MTARELNNWLRSLHSVPEPSVDRVVAGNPETEIRGIAVLWMPTWPALREAAARGLNVIVAHEPTFYTHLDLDESAASLRTLTRAAHDSVVAARETKRRWIEEQGMAVIRCHDVLDAMPGGVVDSLARELGFTPADYLHSVPHFRVVRLPSRTPAREVAMQLANAFSRIGQPGVAFYGDAIRPVGSLGLGTGFGNDPWKHHALGAEMALAIDDRIQTWSEPVWAEDTGYPVAVVNHGTAEEWGVRRLAEIITTGHPGVPVQLLPQGCGYRWITARPT